EGDQLPGLVEALRGPGVSALDPAPLEVSRGIERPEHLAGEAVGGLEDGPRLLLAPGLVRRLAQQLSEPELLQQDEGELPEVRLVPVQSSRHRSTPESTSLAEACARLIPESIRNDAARRRVGARRRQAYFFAAFFGWGTLRRAWDSRGVAFLTPETGVATGSLRGAGAGGAGGRMLSRGAAMSSGGWPDRCRF